MQSVRSQLVARRTYNRPKNAVGTEFETWAETIDRVIGHQRWLWERAAGHELIDEQETELEELRQLMLERKSLVAGRTLWLGGTEVAKKRESSQFNCSFLRANTVHDVVSGFWLLLQGCLPPETPVLTQDGPKPIKDINVGEYVWSYNKTTGDAEYKQVTHTHDVHVAKEDNIKIAGRFGEFITSVKHPVLVMRDEKWQYIPAGSIKLGDNIKKASFAVDEIEPNMEAWFVGAYHGDGCANVTKTGGRRVRLTKDNENVVRVFVNTLADLSGIDVKYKTTDGYSVNYAVPMWMVEKTFAADNKLVTRWDELVGVYEGKKTYTIEPPAWIRKGYDPSAFFSYLAGLLDTDGFIVGDQKAVISTSSKPLVDALQELSPLYGVYPWVTTIEPEQYKSSGYTPTAPMYRIYFTSFDVRHCVDVMQCEYKRENLVKDLGSARTRRRELVVPRHLVDEESDYLGLKYRKWHFNHQVEKTGYCHTGYYVNRDKSYNHLLQYDEVINIETELDIDENFKDLTVDDNHSYFCGFGSYYALHNCGVGFEPVPGTLNGFARPVEVEIIRSKMTVEDWESGIRGEENNYEFYHGKTWTIQVGDSAEAWCKAVGKMLAGKRRVDKLVLDLSQIRAAGIRLKGYGWISSGDSTLAVALSNIANILNKKADKLLNRIDILDVMNHLGTTLSSRRSAEIALVPFNDPEWEGFALAKKDAWTTGNSQRSQSNNSLVFYQKPTKLELRAIFDILKEGGGSEPGFINGEAAKKRAPWFAGLNPCAR